MNKFSNIKNLNLPIEIIEKIYTYDEVISKFIDKKDNYYLKYLIEYVIVNSLKEEFVSDSFYDNSIQNLQDYIASNINSSILTTLSIMDMADLGYNDAKGNGNVLNISNKEFVEIDKLYFNILQSSSYYDESFLNIENYEF